MDELRRVYHDRIATLRTRTIDIVRDAAASVGHVTVALLDGDRAAGELIVLDARGAAARVAEVETVVLDILAQQAPVARDLRVVLASLRIAQVAELCLGLSRTLAARVGQGNGALTAPLRTLTYQIGSGTAGLLEEANGAWIVLDDAQALDVVTGSEACRELQRRFLAELLGMSDVPVDAAVDLGMAARVYERLTDHAVEIAGRVVFAVTGASIPVRLA